MLKELLEFHASVADSVLSTTFVERIEKFICENTYVKGANWSFEDHEFQKAIVNDPRPESDCQKCAQMGLTELEIRRALGFISLNTGATVIYTVPTRSFALKFTKGRIDPIIASSKTLREKLVTGADGSEFKQIGSGFLYIGGAQNTSQSISVPADYLIHDEVDFSNPNALAAYGSRIRHSDFKIRRHFSTPTVSGYGINLRIQSSSQARYSVRCSKCNHEYFPEFFEDVFIPGFDEEFKKFTASDLLNPKYHWKDAHLMCKKCGKVIDKDLADPSRRRWVHAFPNREKAGWIVRPFDLMKYNSVPDIIEQIKQYKRYQDYVNNTHGLTYKSDENEINIGTVASNTVLNEEDSGEACFMGVDVGKRHRVVIAKPVDGKLNILKVLSLIGHEDSASEIAEIFMQYGCLRLVIDSAPDWTLCQQIQAKLGEFAHPCVYLEENKRKPGFFYVQQDTNMVMSYRTTCLDSLVKEINTGKVLFPECDEMEEVRKHYTGMKRTEEYDENGELVPRWTKISDNDHYFHATLYAWIAYRLEEPEVVQSIEVAPTTILSADMSLDRRKSSIIDVDSSVREVLEFMGITGGRNGR